MAIFGFAAVGAASVLAAGLLLFGGGSRRVRRAFEPTDDGTGEDVRNTSRMLGWAVIVCVVALLIAVGLLVLS